MKIRLYLGNCQEKNLKRKDSQRKILVMTMASRGWERIYMGEYSTETVRTTQYIDKQGTPESGGKARGWPLGLSLDKRSKMIQARPASRRKT
jgi:hypothetical protein